MMRALTLAALLLVAPGLAHAQSFLASAGLGVPSAPLDARARALGSIGTGLLGFNGSLVNPADPAVIQWRGVAAALQPMRRTIDYGGSSDQTGATRFPLLHAIHPIGRFTAHVGFGSFIEQSWGIVSLSDHVFGTDTVTVEDQTNVKGGIGQVRVGVSYALSPSFAVGVSAGRYTGHVERVVSRSFPDHPGDEYTPVAIGSGWNYSGTLAAAGFLWDVGTLMRLAGSFTWSGRLSADGIDEHSADHAVQLPLQAVAGATAVLSPELVAAVGFRWDGWSAAAGDVEGGAVDTWHVGGGLEYDGATLRNRPLAIRIGGSYRQLPFAFGGATPSEKVASLGLGWDLGLAGGPIALLDATIERGRVSAPDALNEDFWRLTMGLSLFGQ